MIGISCELSARQMVHMKCHILLSLKNKIYKAVCYNCALRIKDCKPITVIYM